MRTGLRMAFGRQLGVDLKNSVLVRHARGDILRVTPAQARCTAPMESYTNSGPSLR